MCEIKVVNEVINNILKQTAIQKNTFNIYRIEYRRSKNLTVCSPRNSLLCGIPNTAGATLSGTPSSNKH
jgi:hypothetical protein